MSKDTQAHFEVHPSVIFQLGESLVTDTVQALVELVKNSYDADATYAKVIIRTGQTSTSPEGEQFPKGGQIIVEDDGTGMTLEEIEDGWLVISGRRKKDLKQRKGTTPGGRTPLGDKGLGRLGVQRLGNRLDIYTKSTAEAGIHFGFSWQDFTNAPTLSQVKIDLEPYTFPKPQGTRVVVAELRETATWTEEHSVATLREELSKMISPFKEFRNFMIYVEIDNTELELLEITPQVRSLARVSYQITFDGQNLSILGSAKLSHFRVGSSENKDLFTTLVEGDDGKAFFKFLTSLTSAKRLNITHSKRKSWFIDFSVKYPLEEMIELLPDPTAAIQFANPGPFHGEVDYFDLGPDAIDGLHAFSGISEYRSFVKKLSGIYVYRDGFCIRAGKDWLELGTQWTSARSYYGLKPENTIGFIAISARDNDRLQETTNREGFSDDPYYRNFHYLLKRFVKLSADAHNIFGRAWTEFRKDRDEQAANIDSRKTVEDISNAIKSVLQEAPAKLKRVASFETRLAKGNSDAKRIAIELSETKEMTASLKSNALKSINELEALNNSAQDLLTEVSDYLTRAGEMQLAMKVLQDRSETLKDQMDSMHETVALGLIAESLSHEIFTIADNLAKKTRAIKAALSTSADFRRAVNIYVEAVHGTMMGLRKQTSYLSPALRYVREQKQELNLSSFFQEMREFYRERLSRQKISIVIEEGQVSPFMLRINRGKLVQIFDNYIINSEYWLSEEIRNGRQERGNIVIQLAYPLVRLYDDGKGIAQSIEESLFAPFITSKARGHGRGLGLYISKQLLDSAGCSVSLLPERNAFKRLFKFQFDFRGAINE